MANTFLSGKRFYGKQVLVAIDGKVLQGALDKKTRPELIRDLKTLLPVMRTTTLFSTHEDREINVLADMKIESANGRIDSGGST